MCACGDTKRDGTIHGKTVCLVGDVFVRREEA